MNRGFLNRFRSVVYFSLLLCGCCTQRVVAQNPDADDLPAAPVAGTQPSAGDQFPNEKRFVQHLLQDQKTIWTSPAKIRGKSFIWIVPSASVLVGLIITDPVTSREMSRGNHVDLSRNVATAGIASMAAGSAAFYLWGRMVKNDHARETGVLATESMINSLIVSEGLKLVAGRERPNQGNGSGPFFQGGQSFPSDHAALAWSFAAVLAHEYPGWFTKTLAYGGAAAVSLSRVTGKQHFLSDAVVGSVLGYAIGTHVYAVRHDPDLPGDPLVHGTHGAREWKRSGFTYVALDSWVYPALERMVAMGYISAEGLGLRPWTREQCARMTRRLGEVIEDGNGPPDSASDVYTALRREFADELGLNPAESNDKIMLESVYERATEISGRPLNDSYHFGQTIIDDYGRPYQQGFNSALGFTARADTGPLAYYVQGEYQHAPGAPAYPLSVRQVIATADDNPVQPAIPIQQTDQFRLLDAYAALDLNNNEISIGKQSLWWGPLQGGPMIWSTNAEPIYMVRLNRVKPIHLGGPVFLRFDAFFGKLSGHQFPRQPYVHGQKITLQVTKNLEFGFSRTVVFAGEGHPLTFGSFWRGFISVGDNPTSIPGSSQDVGDRRGGFDFAWRVPGLTRWLTFYSDSIADDDPSPLAAPRRSGWSPGLFLSHVPGLPKLDLRVETPFTNLANHDSSGGKFIYFNTAYHDSHTNKGEILGSWVGREGNGVQAWSTYWFGPISSLQVGYRNFKLAPDFIPGGGTQNAYSARAVFQIKPSWQVQGLIQYEKWDVPVLSPNRVSDVVSSVQVTFNPRRLQLRAKPVSQ